MRRASGRPPLRAASGPGAQPLPPVAAGCSDRRAVRCGCGWRFGGFGRNRSSRHFSRRCGDHHSAGRGARPSALVLRDLRHRRRTSVGPNRAQRATRPGSISRTLTTSNEQSSTLSATDLGARSSARCAAAVLARPGLLLRRILRHQHTAVASAGTAARTPELTTFSIRFACTATTPSSRRAIRRWRNRRGGPYREHRAEHVQPAQHTPVDDQMLTRGPHRRPPATMVVAAPQRLTRRDQPPQVPRGPLVTRGPGRPATDASRVILPFEPAPPDRPPAR